MSRATLIVLLMLAPVRRRCDAQGRGAAADARADAPGADGGAFFALRSCHQLLSGDGGEFFSPDYLCANPPLWCNWTVQARPGQRIQLHLEDFTPGDACHLKQDQIHVDEPAGPSGGHRVLQRCWREAKYTSTSNTLHVVLLIGGGHGPQYRGFYGRYQAFGPPVVYNPQDVSTETDGDPPAALVDFGEGGRMESGLSEPADSDPARGSTGAEPQVLEDHSPVPLVTAVPASTQKTSRSGRGVSLSPQNHGPDPRGPTPGPTEADEAPGVETNTLRWRGQESLSGTEVRGAADQRPPTPADPEEAEQAQARAHPHTVELLSEHRGAAGVRNRSATPHVPGDFLLEVSVEVDFSPDPEASWDAQARALLLPLKASIREKLEAEHVLLSLSSKRVKRLNAGVLYILWLQIARGPGAPRVLGSVRAALQDLVASGLGQAVVMSVSTADVNECGTQLLLCDVNADCVNHFGSYSCACRPGFRDESRLGSGGSVCVDVRGCSSGLSAEARGVYVLFFLLSSLMLLLLVVAGVVYRRHHRGAFMVRCRSGVSPPDLNNHHHRDDDDYSYPAEADLPPPPARGPRGAWPQGKERGPAVDLPLLRFGSLLPADGCVQPQEAGKR